MNAADRARLGLGPRAKRPDVTYADVDRMIEVANQIATVSDQLGKLMDALPKGMSVGMQEFLSLAQHATGKAFVALERDRRGWEQARTTQRGLGWDTRMMQALDDAEAILADDGPTQYEPLVVSSSRNAEQAPRSAEDRP